ncbi:hypothetical protein [Nocardia otitidiscaviarum]|uniref:hypothetical protein n=1 Tax=Nocardia otitidiscaviarum TaxID=1823 RepID=UPI0011C01E69|nr:hypothetical protein [Nocardia otitidiscaviarum]
MSLRSGSRRRVASQRRPALVGVVVAAVLGLVVSLVAACASADRSPTAQWVPEVAAVSAGAAAEVTGAAAVAVSADKAPGCRKMPEQPPTPLRDAASHREDIRIPLAIRDTPDPAVAGRSPSVRPVPIETTGPPISPLDLTTVLRI